MDTHRVAQFLYEMGSLRKIARSHRQAFLTNDVSDNISSHSYRVAVIGYFLAKAEKVDAKKVVLMCIFHDSAEARSGDQNWVNKRYVKVFEEEIIRDQMDGLTQDNELFSLINEYSKRESIESKVAKDADRLDQMLLLKEYAQQGNKEAEKWLRGKKPDDLFTQSGKELFIKVIEMNPSEWMKYLWTEKRR